MAVDSEDLVEDVMSGDTLDDYLISLAQGISEAQKKLNQLALNDTTSVNPVLYQIPKVEFELKVSYSLNQQTQSSASGETKKVTRFQVQSLTPESQTEGLTTEGMSTIRGSFVAVPANHGKPPTVLQTAIRRFSATSAGLEVWVRNRAGEVLPNVAVQVNIDREYSATMNGWNGLDQGVSEHTFLEDGVITTDDQGHASTNLTIANDEPSGTNVVIVIDSSGQTETLNYVVES